MSSDHDDDDHDELPLLWKTLTTTTTTATTRKRSTTSSVSRTSVLYLIKAGMCFSLGFYATNVAFQTSQPTFVETIKAAEPITSAVLAISWRLDTMTLLEGYALTGIVVGVVMSTMNGYPTGGGDPTTTPVTPGSSLWVACCIVMASNVCFSLRGLYQKLFLRCVTPTTTTTTTTPTSAPHHSTTTLDDINLQFRMQQTGVAMFIVPTVLVYGPSVFQALFTVASQLSTKEFIAWVVHYLCLATANGLAFSSYK
jgi:drug/metabolite transporter (DMT)-like permease